MRATEIIRGVLDLIDSMDQDSTSSAVTQNQACEIEDAGNSQLKSMLDLLSHSYQTYDNSPAEHISDIKSVTVDAGGGWNGPKQPSDLRADSVSLYPGHQHKSGI